MYCLKRGKQRRFAKPLSTGGVCCPWSSARGWLGRPSDGKGAQGGVSVCRAEGRTCVAAGGVGGTVLGQDPLVDGEVGEMPGVGGTSLGINLMR